MHFLLKKETSLIGVCFLVGCFGPSPQIREIQLSASQRTDLPYRVSLKVENAGSGEGEVEIEIRLKNQGDSTTFQKIEKVHIKSKETISIVSDIATVPGEYMPGKYTVDVKAKYPPS